MSTFRITPEDVGRVAITRNGEKCVITDYGKVLLDTAGGILLGSGSRAEFDNEGKWAINETGLDLIAWADEPATDQVADQVADQDRPKDLRDEFAMVALQGILANPNWSIEDKKWEKGYAEHAYQIADAMMKAREAKP